MGVAAVPQRPPVSDRAPRSFTRSFQAPTTIGHQKTRASQLGVQREARLAQPCWPFPLAVGTARQWAATPAATACPTSAAIPGCEARHNDVLSSLPQRGRTCCHASWTLPPATRRRAPQAALPKTAFPALPGSFDYLWHVERRCKPKPKRKRSADLRTSPRPASRPSLRHQVAASALQIAGPQPVSRAPEFLESAHAPARQVRCSARLLLQLVPHPW